MWFVITIVSFLAIGCVKESEIDKIIAESPIPEKDPPLWKSMIIKSLGIDKPFHINYLCWMGLLKQEDGQYQGVLQGNLGHSLWY
jgi:ABC-type dipeptide/oligopeptide/nickel transport system permease component